MPESDIAQKKLISLVTMGTYGDILPYCSLAMALESAGFRTRLAIPEDHIELAASLGLTAVKCGKNFRKVLESASFRSYLQANALVRFLSSSRVAGLLFDETIEDICAAIRGSSVCVFHPKLEVALDVCEAWKIPAVLGAFQPVTPSRELPIYTWGNGRPSAALFNIF